LSGLRSLRAWVSCTACVFVFASGCQSISGGSAWENLTAQTKKLSWHNDNSVGNPNKVHLTYAKWQEESGNLDNARDSYNTVLGQDRRSTDAIIGLARIDQLSGRTAEAEQGYMKALKLKPNDPHVLDAVGQYYSSQKKWDEAVAMLNSAMMSAPAEKTIRYHLAVALARSGDVERALPHFSKTVGDAVAHYNVGLILHEDNQLAESERYLMQAVLMKPDLEDAQYWLDEVRREQAGQKLYASSDEAEAKAEVEMPRFEELPAPPEYARTQSTRSEIQQVSVEVPDQSAQIQQANRANRKSQMVIQGGSPTLNDSLIKQSLNQSVAIPKKETPQVPPNLSPVQREQWLNQFGGQSE